MHTVYVISAVTDITEQYREKLIHTVTLADITIMRYAQTEVIQLH